MVAFAYTPIPSSMKKHLALGNSGLSSGNLLARADAMAENECVFIIDPSTDDDLEVKENDTNEKPSNVVTNNEKRGRMSMRKSMMQKSIEATIWPHMTQQVFLGMAASSVPIKADVPDLKEELTRAGVRFVYFSPRNMRRSKSVAEKIGIEFDWNCAISLRDLNETEHDPHRYISHYADWDVHARLPHGIKAIRKHLVEVDNVPLLVSLFTDSTPKTVTQMVSIFREYGETVLTIGSSYRANNQSIFSSSDVGIALSMLPGPNPSRGGSNDAGLDTGLGVPSSLRNLLRLFPSMKMNCLSQEDLLLHIRLVSLGTVSLLQNPLTSTNNDHSININDIGDIGGISSIRNPEVRLTAILEYIRIGRLVLLNIIQMLAVLSISLVSLSSWPVIAHIIPLNIPPFLPATTCLICLTVYIPIVLLAMLNSDVHTGVMKNTPRKNLFTRKARDDGRFLTYLAIRAGWVALSMFFVGWVSLASIFRGDSTWQERMAVFYSMEMSSSSSSSSSLLNSDLKGFFLLQDIIASVYVLSLITQSVTLLQRGIGLFNFPTINTHFIFYISMIIMLIIHGIYLGVRAYLRNDLSPSHNYKDLDWIVWFFLFLFPFLGVFIGLRVNVDDDWHYRRYLQFLRLEFDTKLGMHSPR